MLTLAGMPVLEALGMLLPVPGAAPPIWMPRRCVRVASKLASPRSALNLKAVAAACLMSR